MATETGQLNLIDIGTGAVPRNAATIAVPAAPTAYTAVVTGSAITITTADAADLTTTSAALKVLRDEVAVLTTSHGEVLTLLQNIGLRN